MYKIKPDYKKNRVTIVLSGKLKCEEDKLVEDILAEDIEEIKKFVKEMKGVFSELQPGFGLIFDLQKLESISESYRRAISIAMMPTKEIKIGPVIQVISPDKEGETKAWIFDKIIAAFRLQTKVAYSLEDSATDRSLSIPHRHDSL